jgi:hypothetical protein
MRRRLTISAGIIIVTSLVIASLLQDKSGNEPTYRGRKLSYWVLSLGHAKGDDYQGALDTVERLDSNAVPYLIKWIQYERPHWRQVVVVTLAKVPPGAVFIPIAESIACSPREDLANCACRAIRLLSTNEVPQATEALLSIIHKNPGPQTTGRDLGTIQYMGTKALPALIETARNPDHPYRREAIAVLRIEWQLPPTPLSVGVSNAIAELAPELLTNNPAQ